MKHEKVPEQRTLQQNRALHLYFTMIAEAFNEAGLDMRAVLKPDVEIPWNSGTVKEYLWRPIQKVQLGKTSTTKLNKKEIDEVYDTMNRHLAKFGVHVVFPSEESMVELENEKTKSQNEQDEAL